MAAKNNTALDIIKQIKKQGGEAAWKKSREKTDPYKGCTAPDGNYVIRFTGFPLRTSGKGKPYANLNMVIIGDMNADLSYAGQRPSIYHALDVVKGTKEKPEGTTLEQRLDRIAYTLQAMNYDTSKFELDDLPGIDEFLKSDKPFGEICLKTKKGSNGTDMQNCNIVRMLTVEEVTEIGLDSAADVEVADDEDGNYGAEAEEPEASAAPPPPAKGGASKPPGGGKKAAATPEPEDDEQDAPGQEEEEQDAPTSDPFSEMDRAALKAYIKENGLEVTYYKQTTDDEIRDAIRALVGNGAAEDLSDPEQDEPEAPKPTKPAGKPAAKPGTKGAPQPATMAASKGKAPPPPPGKK